MLLQPGRSSRWTSRPTTTSRPAPADPDPRPATGRSSPANFELHVDIKLDRVAYDAASDGCFPLISNDRDLPDADVLGAYRYHPKLERRHHLLKSVQDAAPVLLHNPARIEALFCCQFLALLICALIEREVRNGMRRAALDNIALYPEFRDCKAPSAERILDIFAPVARHQLHRDGTLVKTFHPDLTSQQLQVLELLGLPPSAYPQQAQSTRYRAPDVRNVRLMGLLPHQQVHEPFGAEELTSRGPRLHHPVAEQQKPVTRLQRRLHDAVLAAAEAQRNARVGDELAERAARTSSSAGCAAHNVRRAPRATSSSASTPVTKLSSPNCADSAPSIAPAVAIRSRPPRRALR